MFLLGGRYGYMLAWPLETDTLYFRNAPQLNRVLTGHKRPHLSIFKFTEELSKSVSSDTYRFLFCFSFKQSTSRRRRRRRK